MKIAHIIWALSTGGAETMLVDIANIQVNTEQVAIVVVNDLIEKTLLNKIDKRCRLLLLKRKTGSRSLVPWVHLNNFLYRFRPDIIHFHLEGMRKMVFYPAPKVFTIHNTHTSGKEYNHYQALYAISDGVKAYTMKQGYDSRTIWNGIDTKLIKQRTDGQYKSGTICKIVCVGRLFTPHKGQDILIAALGHLKEQGELQLHLDLIGDGDSREELERLINLYNLTDYVTLLGHRSRSFVYEHLSNYDLFVLPSRSEGFGLSVAEAMCARIPVLVCNLPGVMDVIDGGRVGMFFQAGNINSLAEHISKYIREGSSEQMVKEAATFALTHLDISRTAQEYIDEYEKVIKSTSR